MPGIEKLKKICLITKISNFGEDFLSSFPFEIFEKFINKVTFLFFYNIFFFLLIDFGNGLSHSQTWQSTYKVISFQLYKLQKRHHKRLIHFK